MNGAHLHLLVNHIPVFSVAFGLLAFVWALAKRSSDMRWAAIALFVVAGIFAWVASETGELAEKIVEHLPGVTKELIHEHEEAAEGANIVVALLAAASLSLVAVMRFKPQLQKIVQGLMLLLALVATVLMARTAYLGGQINHAEIRTEAPADVK